MIKIIIIVYAVELKTAAGKYMPNNTKASYRRCHGKITNKKHKTDVVIIHISYNLFTQNIIKRKIGIISRGFLFVLNWPRTIEFKTIVRPVTKTRVLIED